MKNHTDKSIDKYDERYWLRQNEDHQGKSKCDNCLDILTASGWDRFNLSPSADSIFTNGKSNPLQKARETVGQ